MSRQTIKQELIVQDKGSSVVDSATKKIKSDLDSVERTSTNVTSKMIKSWRSVITVLGTAGVGLAIGNLLRSTINYADELGKLNTRLGINVTEFDKLRQVADLSGVSFQTLTMATQRMTRRLAEVATTGGGVAADAIKKLSLSIDSLMGMSPDQQFLEIAKALSQVSSDGERVALAFKLFDSEGVKVLQMLPSLANGLEGITSNMSLEKAREAEAFNDQITKIHEQFRQLAIEVIPSLNTALKTLTENFREIATAITILIGLAFATWIKGIVTSLGSMLGAMLGIKLAGKVFQFGSTSYFLGNVSGWRKMTSILSAVIDKLKGLLFLLVTPQGLAAGIIIITLAAIANAIYDIYEASKKAEEETRNLSEAINELGKLDSVQGQQLENLNNRISELYDQLLEPDIGDGTYQAIQKEIEGLEQQRDALIEIQRVLRENQRLMLKAESDSKKSRTHITPDTSAYKMIPGLDTEYLGLIGKKMDQQIALANQKYDEMIKKANNSAAVIAKIERNREQEIANIRKEYNEKALKELKEQKDKERKLIEEYLISLAKAQGEYKFDPEMARYEGAQGAHTTESALQAVVDRHKEANEKIREFYQETGDEIAMTFKDSFKSLITGAQEWEDVMINMLNRLGDAFLELAFKQLQANMLAGSGSSTFGGAIASGLAALFGAANGAVLPGGFQAFAGGGMVNKPTLGLIGEGKYNEAVVPLPDGRSIPVQMQGSGEQYNVNINITNTAPHSEREARSQGTIIRQQFDRWFDSRLQYQNKPGGILRRQPGMGR